jgi:hypothetical protein
MRQVQWIHLALVLLLGLLLGALFYWWVVTPQEAVMPEQAPAPASVGRPRPESKLLPSDATGRSARTVVKK